MHEFEAPDWRALHSSLARRKRFAFCPVGYYLYHVPGRDGYAGHSDSWRYKLYCAKHALSKNGFCQALFRQGVRDFFRPGKDFRREKFEKFLRRKFEHQFSLLENQAFADDPKLVPSIIELNEKLLDPESIYEQSLFVLNDLTGKFLSSELFCNLSQIPLLDFYYEEKIWSWQLGGVIFTQQPDLVWKSGQYLYLLDMNHYSHLQEQARAGLLYKVYCLRFMHIPPEAVKIIFYTPASGEAAELQESSEEFAAVYHKLSSEAAMWRDYLLLQQRDSSAGNWHYARFDNCARCRFKALCPARTGTPETEQNSI